MPESVGEIGLGVPGWAKEPCYRLSSRTVGGASADGVKRLDFLGAVLEDADQAVLGEVTQGV